MDVGRRFGLDLLVWFGRGWNPMVNPGCFWWRFVLHLDGGLVFAAKLEGNPLGPVVFAHLGLVLGCVEHGASMVKP